MSFGIPVRNGLAIGLGSVVSLGVASGPPASLFANGEAGAWYDPSDRTTLFQDSAGTTAVTAVEQPVGLMLDKSGRGNHATQSTSTARPTLRALYNLLTKTEQFNDAAWTKSSVTVTANTDTAPDGTATADTLAATGANGTTLGSLTAVAASHTFSVYLKRKTGTGNIDISAHSSGTWVTQTITSSWARYTVTQTLTAGTVTPGIRIVTSGDEVYAWGAQLIVANDLTSNAYQRVDTATSYDADPSKFLPYLAFDGTDDFMTTSAINFTATDESTVFAGVRRQGVKGGGAAFRIVELSTSSANNGIFTMAGPDGASDLAWASIGTAAAIADVASGYVTPLTSVLTGIADISADVATLRHNGAQIATSATDQGTGNYGNYALFIGSRGGASQYFLGRIYSLIVRGAATSAADITATEQYVAGKTGVTL